VMHFECLITFWQIYCTTDTCQPGRFWSCILHMLSSFTWWAQWNYTRYYWIPRIDLTGGRDREIVRECFRR
jgi:hypothetical protein